MILRDKIMILALDYVTRKEVRCKLIRFERYPRAVFALHRRVFERVTDVDGTVIEAQTEDWVVTEVRTTCWVAHASSPEEAMRKANKRLADNTSSYREFNRHCARVAKNFEDNCDSNEIPWMGNTIQRELPDIPFVILEEDRIELRKQLEA